MTRKTILIGLWILSMTVMGCDDRATQIAREAANRQAQQNTAMAELQKDVASGTRELVAADGKARQQIFDVHHELQAERQRLDTGWNSLEEERRTMADQRRAESVLVPFLTVAGGGLLAALTLGFSWYALCAPRASESEAAMNEILVSEVIAGDSPIETLAGPSHRPLIRRS